MPSSSASAEAPSPVRGIIAELPQLRTSLSKIKDSIPKSEPKNARSTTGSNCILSCWNPNEAQPKSSPDPSPADATPNNLELFNPSEKLERNIKYAERALTKLKGLEQDVCSLQTLEQQICILKHIQNNFCKFECKANVDLAQAVQDMVSLLEKMLTDLKHQVKALQNKRDYIHSDDASGTVAGTPFDAYYLVGEKQRGDVKNKIQGSSAFLEFYEDSLEVFKHLDTKTKLGLMCFSVFPAKAVVKKRVLVQWWIGEGFVDSHSDATKILRVIVAKGFVEPDLKNRRLVGFKINPLVRLVLVRIAEEFGFLSFDFSWSVRACLVVRDKESSRVQLTSHVPPEKRGVLQEKLHTLFNVNDPYPDFKKDWFSKLKNLNVLCLGGWQGAAGQHIEIEATEFLDALEDMKYLKLLSLQGISRITKLPDSICKLKNLLILDLKACHNLEALPKNIDALKNLTHLDVSECYLLDHIPEGLASLSQLRVLKGFLIGQSKSKKSCGLEALAKLKVLEKLSINTAKQNFPTEEDVKVLRRLEHLEKLKVTWRGKPSRAQTGKSSGPEKASLNPWYESAFKTCVDQIRAKQKDRSASAQPAGKRAPDRQPSKKSTPTDGMPATAASTISGGKNLQKVELQCFPGSTPPAWLTEGKLKPEKKLYISGGKLQSLGTEQGEDITWKVQVLRLRFLKELKGDWREVRKSFPGLIYLEKVKCPGLAFFPCDENGVWLKQESESEMEDLGLTWSFRRRRTT